MTDGIEDEAVCIRHWDFSESSQTVGVFSKSQGLVRAIARGSRRTKGEFSGGVDLLTRARTTIIIKPTSELATLSSWVLLENFPGTRRAIQANRAAYYAADLVGRLFEAHDPHPHVYDGLVKFLRRLGEPHNDEVTLLEFQWLILKEAGFQPLLGKPHADKAVVEFDPRAGGAIVDQQSPTSWRVRAQTIHLLQDLTTGEQQIEPEALSFARANRLLAAYTREILGEEPFTMRTLFGELTPRTS